MSNVTRNFNPSNLFQNPCTVFLNVQSPTSAIPAVSGTNLWALQSGTYQLDANGEPTDNGSAGICLGLTEGPADLKITPKFLEIRGDQFADPVDAAFVSTEFEISFVMKEFLLSNLQAVFTSSLGTYTAVSAGANPAAQFLQIGSQVGTNVTFATVLLIAPDHGNAGHFVLVNAYKCFLKAAIQTTFKRDTQNMWKITFTAIGDVTRVAGDYVAQIVRL